jgi:hypothetical protein
LEPQRHSIIARAFEEQEVMSPVTSKPASRGRIKTGHSEAGISKQIQGLMPGMFI